MQKTSMHFIQPHHLRNVGVETIGDVETCVQQEDLVLDFQPVIYWLNILMMVQSPSQIMKSLSWLHLPSIMKLTIYVQKKYCDNDSSWNMHGGSIILNVRMYSSQMLNILLSSTTKVFSLIITKLSIYMSNLLNLNASVVMSYQLTH